MNETDLIRRQIAVEQQHAGELLSLYAPVLTEVSDAGGASRGRYADFRRAYVPYLELIEGRLRARAQAHERRLRAIDARLGAHGGLREKLSQSLAVAQTTGSRCSAARALLIENSDILIDKLIVYSHFVKLYIRSLDELDAFAAPLYGLDDWRQVAQIDADAVLEERRRYEELTTQAQPHSGCRA